MASAQHCADYIIIIILMTMKARRPSKSVSLRLNAIYKSLPKYLGFWDDITYC